MVISRSIFIFLLVATLCSQGAYAQVSANDVRKMDPLVLLRLGELVEFDWKGSGQKLPELVGETRAIILMGYLGMTAHEWNKHARKLARVLRNNGLIAKARKQKGVVLLHISGDRGRSESWEQPIYAKGQNYPKKFINRKHYYGINYINDKFGSKEIAERHALKNAKTHLGNDYDVSVSFDEAEGSPRYMFTLEVTRVSPPPAQQ